MEAALALLTQDVFFYSNGLLRIWTAHPKQRRFTA
jgi:hypothetical protein